MARIKSVQTAARLVLEPESGFALVDGEAIELPPRESRLLGALVGRLGQPVPTVELMQAVWPEDWEWTSKEDLYVLVSKLRRLIDGPRKLGQHIRNRRGFGYMLDLEPDEVSVGASVDDQEDRVVDLEQSDPAVAPAPSEPDHLEGLGSLESQGDRSLQHPEPHPGEPWLRHVLVVGVALLLVAVSWSTGYLLSTRDEAPLQPQQATAPADQESQGVRSDDRKTATTIRNRRGRDRKRTVQRNPGRAIDDATETPAMAAADSVSDPVNTNVDRAPSRPGTAKVPAKESEGRASSPLPPAPTRYLYHLVNPETGDHFVTTDSGTASEHHGLGYRGGAVGRIYTYREDNTKAIATNHGTAYIFNSSAPKTDPASRAVALWYSSNSKGDFFYSISESEATREGWTGSLVGYVGSL